MRTSQPHVFCVGDANGLQETVHVAIQQGEVAAYNATHLGSPPHRMDYRLKLDVTFTEPAVASVGMSEKECRRQKWRTWLPGTRSTTRQVDPHG